jgi:hypothetical protein
MGGREMRGTLYFAMLFYPSLAECAKQVNEVKKEVNQMSNGDYRILAYGANPCCIGFVTDTPQTQIQARLCTIQGEKFHMLLMEAPRATFGAMSKQNWEWVSKRLPPDSQ